MWFDWINLGKYTWVVMAVHPLSNVSLEVNTNEISWISNEMIKSGRVHFVYINMKSKREWGVFKQIFCGQGRVNVPLLYILCKEPVFYILWCLVVSLYSFMFAATMSY